MNEWQHDKLRELQAARGQVKLKTIELRAAKRRERKAKSELRDAVRRDPESWYGTPGHEKYGLEGTQQRDAG